MFQKICVITFLLFFVFAGKSLARTPWHITAQKMSYLAGKKILIAEGDVLIKSKNMTISCTRLEYELKSKTATLFGPITIDADGDNLYGTYGWINLETFRGEIRNAHLSLGPGKIEAFALGTTRVHLLAKRIQILGRETYQAKKALITTCDVCYLEKKCGSPDWSFKCRDLKVTPDGKARARDLTFNLKRLPVFYTPYLSLAVKTRRHSGFLMPRLVQGTSEGFGIEWPYFLAINDSFDLTFYPFYTGKRGFMAGVEGNYALSEKSFGTFRARYIKDRLKDNDYNQDGLIRTNQNRYWITGKFDQELAPGWPLRLDLDILSDRDFLYEFLGGDLGFDQSNQSYLYYFGRGLDEKNSFYRTNRLWLTHAFGDYFFQTSATYYDGVIPGDQPYIMQPLPRVYFSRLTAPVLGLFNFSLENDYVRWWREKGFRGHRLEIIPEASINPHFWQPLDLRFAYRLRQAFYWVDWRDGMEGETLSRTLPEIEARAGMNFSRVFRTNRLGLVGLKHTLRPQLTFFYRPEVNQDDLPAFTMDDHLPPVSRIDYGLLQFVTAKEKTNDGFRYFDMIRLWIHQSYDFREASRDLESPDDERKPLSDLYAEGEANLLKKIHLRATTSYNFYGLGWASANLSASLRNDRGESFGFDYRWDKFRKIKQINMRFLKNVFRGFWFGYRVQYSLKEGEATSSEMHFEYRTKCWWAYVKFYYNPHETRYSFYINLVGIGGWGR